ncbi:MAG TPA: prepilin-type N-terminal cleavage/methylation domain-containing protein [Nitrospirota bacterium]
MGNKSGFTLIELMVVVAIIGILASLAQPMFKTATLKSREAALKEDLFNMRSVIDQYYADNGEYPSSLNDLVDKGYMRSVPVDPFTREADWQEVSYSGDESGEGAGGIYDVHSSSGGAGLDGVPYSDW